ncbi:hypothetical protein B0H11DRAFT_2429030 [Mycena galericulata]|nr:hypothetical protein B0H11DRAFT_2429030 [Mycena galericulata]
MDSDVDNHRADDDGLEDADVDGMLKGVIARNPARKQCFAVALTWVIQSYSQVDKWFVSSPSVMKKKEKAKEAKEKRKESKQKRLRDDSDSDDDSAKTTKRRKKSDDAASKTPVEITGYPDPKTLYIRRGPFKFFSDCSFEDFLVKITDILPCPIENIVLDKVEWKPQTPANRTPLPLGGTVGYSVLCNEMKERSKARIVIISMPGPRKRADDAPFWDTQDVDTAPVAGPSNAAMKEFDFEELEANNIEQSVAQQKMTFDKAVGPNVEMLKERWPLGNDGKRVYTDEQGFQWELNPIRLNVWASHMARGTATADKAPVSAQFDIKNRLKNRNSAPPTNPATPVIQPTASNVTPAPNTSTVSERLLEVLTISLLQQQQLQAHAPIPTVNPPVAPTIPIRSPIPSVPHSPEKLPHRRISLEEFCTHYDVLNLLERLQKLEYEPGDSGITKLERADWQEYAGFSKLAWEKVLSTHRRFLADVKAGMWS